jgi:hypothetical protein
MIAASPKGLIRTISAIPSGEVILYSAVPMMTDSWLLSAPRRSKQNDSNHAWGSLLTFHL